MAFRVNRAYERWWEARSLWGKLVNVSRNLAIKVRAYAEPDEADREETHRLIQGFSRALKNHLRREGKLQDIPEFGSDPAQPAHVPAYVAARIYDRLEEARRKGRVTDGQQRILDKEARELMEVAGDCEKILNTPMPPSFLAFVRVCIALLLFTFPWDLADAIGWWTFPAMVVATFLLAGGEAIAQAVEQPFETGTDDLDLEGICNEIDCSTAEILGLKPCA